MSWKMQKQRIRIPIFEQFENRTLLASDLPPLVDLAQNIRSPIFNPPNDLKSCNGLVYFTTETVTSGKELWRTNPTSNDTQQLTDIVPGPNGGGIVASSFQCLDKFYFAARGGWRATDGAVGGTRLVIPLSNSQNVSASVVFQGALYYLIVDTSSGNPVYELWRSDGTQSGTSLLKDLGRNTQVSWTPYLGLHADGIVASVPTGIWKSDGTSAGTVLVASSATSGVANPSGFASIGHNLYFYSYTNSAVGVIRNFDADASYQYIANGVLLFEMNGSVFYKNSDKLFRYDESSGSISLVKDFQGTSGNFKSATRVGSTIYVNTYNGIWESDGTTAGTRLINSLPYPFLYLTNFKDTLYSFQENYGLVRIENSKVTRVRTGAFFDIKNSGDVMYLKNSLGSSIYDYWKSDGSTSGTQFSFKLQEDDARTNAKPIEFMNENFFFLAQKAGIDEVWTSKGTAASTENLAYASRTVIDRPVFASFKNKTFFNGNDGVSGEELWVSDGTKSGTVPFQDLIPGSESSYPRHFFQLQGRLQVAGNGIWDTDGTTEGTSKLSPLAFVGSSSAQVGGVEYFYAGNVGGSGNFQIARTDGTASGTYALTNLPSLHSTGSFASLGEAFYFTSGSSSTDGIWLYRSDGTAQGTVPLVQVTPSFLLADISLCVFRDRLYFLKAVGEKTELWSTDGTVGGTKRVSSVEMGASSSLTRQLAFASTDTELFFRGVKTDGMMGLWKTDGTEAGTVPVRDFGVDLGMQRVSSLQNINGIIYFQANDGDRGYELWRSNGTFEGTQLVLDVADTVKSSFPSPVMSSGYKLMFAAETDSYGREMYLVDETPPAVSMVLDSVALEESSGSFQLSVTLPKPYLLPITVNLGWSGTASNSIDFDGVDSVVIPAGVTSISRSIVIRDDIIDEPNEKVTVEIVSVLNSIESGVQKASLTINDNDLPPLVSLSQSNDHYLESSGGMTLVATLSAPSAYPVTVKLNYAGSATLGSDFTYESTSLIISPGNTTAEGQVTFINDIVDELDETLLIDVLSVVNASENGVQRLTATIIDDDLPPIVSVSTNSPIIPESNGNGVIRVALSEKSSLPVTVALGFGGQASLQDFTYSRSELIIPAGSLVAEMQIASRIDAMFEGDEILQVAIASAINARIGSGTSVDVLIRDDDLVPIISARLDRQSISEAGGSVGLELSLSNPSAFPINGVIEASGTATKDLDFSIAESGLIIPPGELVHTVRVNSVQDTLDELVEQVILRLANISGANMPLDSVSFTILDEDPPPNVVLTKNVSEIIEEAGEGRLLLQLSSASALPVTINLELSGTASETADFRIQNRQVVIPAGDTMAEITITSVPDLIDEIDESIIVSIANVANGIEFGNQSQIVKLIDDDATPILSLDTQKETIVEDSGTANVRLSLDRPSSLPIAVTLGFSGTAMKIADYRLTSESVTFAPGETSKEIRVVAESDSLDENNETIEITISSATNASAPPDLVSVLSIEDDDAPSLVTLTASRSSISEASGSTVLTATLSKLSSFPVSVPLLLSGGAQNSLDYIISANVIVIPPGSKSGTIQLGALQDAIDEANEQVEVRLGSITHGIENGPQLVAVTILDDDPVPKVRLTADKPTIGEDLGKANIMISLSGPSSRDVVVELQATGTMDANDYAINSSSIVVPAGELFAVVELVARQDTVDEADELIRFDVVRIENGLEEGSQQITLTVIDDDAPPKVSLAANANDRTEGSSFIVSATLDAISSLPVSVELTFAGSAKLGDDFAVANARIVIPPGETTGILEVTTLQDAIYEIVETIDIQITTVSNGEEDGVQFRSLGIVDDESIPLILVESSRDSISEASGSSIILFKLSGVSSLPVTVFLHFDGEALPNSDFTSTATEVLIPAGTTSQSVTIQAKSDVLDEAEERIIIGIASMVNADLGPIREKTISIIDDDPPPRLTISTSTNSIAEEAGSAVITADLSQPSSQSVAIDFTMLGSAKLGVDFAATSSRILIEAGATHGSLTISGLGDSLTEPGEFFTIAAENSVNAVIEGNRQFEIEIVDDDAELDFGDAPMPYAVTLAQNGARHVKGQLYLGKSIASEANGVSNATANGEPEDDGVRFLATITADVHGSISSVWLESSGPGRIDAWIDFNHDGDWEDAGEQVFVSSPVELGANLLSFAVPAFAKSGFSAARFRLSSLGGLSSVGLAADGEVEDYWVATVPNNSHANLTANLPVPGLVELSSNEGIVKVQFQNKTLMQFMSNDTGAFHFDGTAGNDEVRILNGIDFMQNRFKLDLGRGNDRVTFVGKDNTIDLVAATTLVMGIEVLDIRGAGTNQLLIDQTSVVRVTGGIATLQILKNQDDVVQYGGGWSLDTPVWLDSQFYHRLTSEKASINLWDEQPFSNPLDRNNSNRDQFISPLDALIVINILNIEGSKQLQMPAAGSDLRSHRYVDTTGEGTLSPLDALRILNYLNLRGAGEGEGSAGQSLDTIEYVSSSDQDERHRNHYFSSLASQIRLNYESQKSRIPNRK